MSWGTNHKILRKEYKCNKNCEIALVSYKDQDIPDYPLLPDIPESESWIDLKKNYIVNIRATTNFSKTKVVQNGLHMNKQ